MGLFGSLLKGTGNVVGGASKYAVKGAAHLIGGISELAGSDEFADKARNLGDVTGDFLHTTGKITGSVLGTTADVVVDTSTKVGSSIVGGIAELAGADKKTVQTAKVIGSVVGGSVAGLGIGSGAGMAGGQAVLTGINVLGGTSGAVQAGVNKYEEEKDHGCSLGVLQYSSEINKLLYEAAEIKTHLLEKENKLKKEFIVSIRNEFYKKGFESYIDRTDKLEDCMVGVKNENGKIQVRYAPKHLDGWRPIFNRNESVSLYALESHGFSLITDHENINKIEGKFLLSLDFGKQQYFMAILGVDQALPYQEILKGDLEGDIKTHKLKTVDDYQIEYHRLLNIINKQKLFVSQFSIQEYIKIGLFYADYEKGYFGKSAKLKPLGLYTDINKLSDILAKQI